MPALRSTRIAAPILLLGLSTLAALGIAEVGLRILKPQAFPTLPRGMFTQREDGFTVLTPGFEGTISRAEFHAPFRIGDFGVRGQGPAPRRENSFQILALGDSQTFGFGVLDHETYCVRLEEILAARHPELDIRVVNAGVPGYGTVDEVVWLRERGREVDPDLIVAQFLSVNDFKINRASPHAATLLGEATAAGAHPRPAAQARAHESLASRLVGAIHALKRRSHVATLVVEGGSYVGMRLGLLGGLAAMWGEDFTPEDAGRTRRLLVLLAREAQQMGVPVVLVYTTGKAQVIARDAADLPSASVMAAAVAEAGVPWIHMTRELRRRHDRQELYFIRDGHWTAAGHQAVAEVLAQRLAELGVLPSGPSS